ncbi:uncharacterized protein pdgfbb isoform X2 [Gouania willdenowi]|uniref:uncharacterized protein pdgfbb isoform X2 n=1 Tax=Gouania willdenowi TaxID=441366 RepID=UPI001056B613|nr:uncharacterized protein LOC114469032 isoform X2 [Gouania willdenowi]
MSSWVLLLLLALLSTCVRCGVAEGDALPAALVELVRNSPISSIQDLQLLLLSDSVDAQPAQQAVCKVRTEVVEVTRAMLDRSNANFLLWPPCVEVQRCSGCCNTKSLQCVPVLTHTRYLQVMKIEYMNKRPLYAKAVVSVVDHVECQCQPAPRAPMSRKKSSRRHHSHRNQTLSQGSAQDQVRAHSKDELHQWDELKQNQRVHLQDLLDKRWSSRGDTFNQPGKEVDYYREDTSQSGDPVLFSSHWTHNSTWTLGTGVDPTGSLIGHTQSDNKTVSSISNVEEKDQLNNLLLNINTQIQSPSKQEDESNTENSHAGQTPQHVTENPQAGFTAVEGTFTERTRNWFRPTKEPNPDPPEQGTRIDNDTPDHERVLQLEKARLEQEREELLLLHKRLDQEKEVLRQQQIKQQQEKRLREKEQEENHHLVLSKPQHHLQTDKPATSSIATRQQVGPAGPRPPARPKQSRRRMRKNRKRISKAAMRAMLM